jgi:hypothetical protein
VNSGDSYVIDVLDVITHQLRGDDCFFGYWDVTGSGGHDHDHALAVRLAIALEDDGAREWTIVGLGPMVSECGGDGGVLFFGGSRGQHVAAVGGEAGEDFSHLAGRFALGKNHLGHALAQGAMMVELGETQVLKGQVTQALYGFVGGEALFSNLLEELAKGF